MTIFEACREISCIDAALAMGIELKKNNGRTAWTLCPIHGERGHPSLFMSADRGWYCYGCHRGGHDAVSFYQAMYGMTPLEAAQRCAADFGLRYDDAEPDNVIHVTARHLRNALHKRRDAVRRELATAECDIDDTIQMMLHTNGMESCADDPTFYRLVEQRSNLQVMMDRLLTQDDGLLLELLQEYDRKAKEQA